MKKLKLKKEARNGLIIGGLVIILLVTGSIYGIKFIKQKQYEKTYEYKLNTLGYELKQAKYLDKELKDKELDYLLTIECNPFIINIINDKYFIYSKFYDYLEYHNNHQEMDERSVVELVNANRFKEYYTDIKKTDISKKELMLVNKYNKLEPDYEPENLVTIPTTYAWGEEGYHKITKVTYDAFLKMWNDAKNSGFYLMVNSSYRTSQKQEEIYNEYKNSHGTEYADNYAARSGHSEHQTGYVLDLSEQRNTNKNTFHETEVYKWLLDNSYKYGFILRCSKEKENVTGYKFESWHYRYVGVDAATYIHDNNITFEEYYAYFVDK